MSNIRTFTRAFSGGEVTPEFYGRIDDAKYQMGLAGCRNFEVLPHGPVQNRAGFEYVLEVKFSAKPTRLIPFVYSTDQTMVLEFGDQYVRFHTQGGTLLEATQTVTSWTNANPGVFTLNAHGYGNGQWLYVNAPGIAALAGRWCIVANATANTFTLTDLAGNAIDTTAMGALPAGTTVARCYEIASSYAAADLFDLHFVQSADVLTLAHPGYQPQELRRNGATNWSFTNISFVSMLSPPTNLAATANVGSGTANTNYVYGLTTVGSNGLDESLLSATVTCYGNLLANGASNTITFTPAANGTRYNVYKKSNGLFGYIGQTDSSGSFVDDNITADITKTPPQQNNPFPGPGDYPGAVSYYEQRRCFAGTTNKPQNIWMTRSGTESDMSYSIPTRDDDSIAFRAAALEANTIRHIVPLTQMILLTSSAEWRVTSINSDALTPTSVDVKPQSYIGASNVRPAIVNNNLIYAAARGGHMRELAYSWQANGYVSGDLSLRAPHLFDNLTIKDMAYAKSPQPIVWAVSSNGDLLGLTYVPEQQIGAWHRHDTAGSFESVAVVAEGNEDILYAVVNRTVNGRQVRYIERKRSRLYVSPADYFFVDAGLTYNGPAVSTVNGLWHLEGCTVNILADGAVMPQQTVTNGAITLPQAASLINIGLPITADLETLPVIVQNLDGFGQGRIKNVNRVWLRVYRSSGIFVGPSTDRLTEAKQRTTENYGAPPALKSDEIEVVIPPAYSRGGQVYVRQTDPLPLTVVSLTLEVAIGG